MSMKNIRGSQVGIPDQAFLSGVHDIIYTSLELREQSTPFISSELKEAVEDREPINKGTSLAFCFQHSE